jgi:hypothetical protein
MKPDEFIRSKHQFFKHYDKSKETLVHDCCDFNDKIKGLENHLADERQKEWTRRTEMDKAQNATARAIGERDVLKSIVKKLTDSLNEAIGRII